jgi:hypothetical protein
MYVFEEFNRNHINQIRSSLLIDVAIVFIGWSLTFLPLENPTAALKITLFGLLAVYVVRIPRLMRHHDLNLTLVQYLVSLAMALTAGLLVLFAFSKTTGGESTSSNMYRSVLLSLGLAVYPLLYVNFALASLFQRMNSRTR